MILSKYWCFQISNTCVKSLSFGFYVVMLFISFTVFKSEFGLHSMHSKSKHVITGRKSADLASQWVDKIVAKSSEYTCTDDR